LSSLCDKPIERNWYKKTRKKRLGRFDI